jgi:hypothetical protein
MNRNSGTEPRPPASPSATYCLRPPSLRWQLAGVKHLFYHQPIQSESRILGHCAYDCICVFIASRFIPYERHRLMWHPDSRFDEWVFGLDFTQDEINLLSVLFIRSRPYFVDPEYRSLAIEDDAKMIRTPPLIATDRSGEPQTFPCRTGCGFVLVNRASGGANMLACLIHWFFQFLHRHHRAAGGASSTFAFHLLTYASPAASCSFLFRRVTEFNVIHWNCQLLTIH